MNPTLNKKLNSQVIFNLLLKSNNEQNIQKQVESYLYEKIPDEIWEDTLKSIGKLLEEWNLINESFKDYKIKFMMEEDDASKDEMLIEIENDMKHRHKLNIELYKEIGDDRLMIQNNLLNSSYHKYC